MALKPSVFPNFVATLRSYKLCELLHSCFLWCSKGLETVCSSILNTEHQCTKIKKTCLVIHLCSRSFGKHCSKSGFQNNSFEITSDLFLNNKHLSGNWVIILKTVWAHLVKHICVLSHLFLSLISSPLHAKSICTYQDPTQSEL